jgi:hypothetical protein
MYMTDRNGPRPYTHSNDRWNAEAVHQLSAMLPETDPDEQRSALVIGNGMMPYLLTVVRPDVLVIADSDIRAIAKTKEEIQAAAHFNSLEEYTAWIREDLAGFGNTTFDFDAELRRARRSKLVSSAGFSALKHAAEHVRVSSVCGDITDKETASEIQEALDGTRPIFANLTNVASWLRPYGPFSSKQIGWDKTREFLDAVGMAEDAAIVDSDHSLLRPRVFRKDEYRLPTHGSRLGLRR